MVANLLEDIVVRALGFSFKSSGLALVLGMAVGLLTCACQPPKSSNPAQAPFSGAPPITAADSKSLVHSDLNEMAQPGDEREAEALRAYDQSHGGIFSQIFGGPSKAHAKNFIDERIKYFLTPEELKAWQVPSLQKQPQNWITESDSETEKKMTEKNAQVIAVNSGMGLWLENVIFGFNHALEIPGRGLVPVESSRIGVMMIGPGYQPSRPFEFKNEGVKVVATQPDYRQRTLVHEARHSDCTGGLSEDDLTIVRKVRSLKEFMERYPNLACGHIHVNCPEGHPLAGIPACDRHPWGAYSVDAIYSEGTLAAMSAGNRAGDHTARVIAEMQVLDSWSRVLVKKEGLLSGRLGQPDMTHVDSIRKHRTND